MKINTTFKIILINTSCLGAFLIILASVFEVVTRSANPFSLLPPELTQKQNVIVDKKVVAFADARPTVSALEPKTNTLYAHNDLGFRAQSTTDHLTFASDPPSYPTILSIGDSTNYGLNINVEETFSFKYSQKLNQSLINSSYPGMNLNGIYYKLSCALSLQKKQILPLTDVVISFYYNDIESLDLLPLDPSSCNDFADLNLVHSFKHTQSINPTPVGPQRSFWTKLFDLNTYSWRFKKLICKDLFPMSCKYVKFSISNISPAFRNIVFGSTRELPTEDNLQINDTRLREWKLRYKEVLSELSKYANITIIYVPRNELDLGFLDKKREYIYGYFRSICLSNSEIRCIDGAELILKSLSPDQLANFKISQRLPTSYYSYLPMYDLGHPSEFVSGLYSEALLRQSR